MACTVVSTSHTVVSQWRSLAQQPCGMLTQLFRPSLTQGTSSSSLDMVLLLPRDSTPLPRWSHSLGRRERKLGSVSTQSLAECLDSSMSCLLKLVCHTML